MATLFVRNPNEGVAAALRQRAARRRLSVAAEHRAILEAALRGDPTTDFKEFLSGMPDGGGDDLFTRNAGLPRDVLL